VDFSGGEKKRNEILQMAVLQPRLALLDEIDSGLDVDALQQVAAALNHVKTPENAYLLITHYHRILEYVKPHHVHILAGGRIVHSGDHTLALEVEKHGYEPFLRERA
jgi:Fe-S cluster assembly ATP-binding protein